MLQEISLAEALTGTKFHITHLDGRVLEVSSPAGHVIKPDSWKCIEDEGMPVHTQSFYKGNLYIHFSVQFPDTLDEAQVAGLSQIFRVDPNAYGPMDIADVEQVSPRLAPTSILPTTRLIIGTIQSSCMVSASLPSV